MRNRYRIEVYDEDKNNDLTLFSDERIDKSHLTEIVFSNLARFRGSIKAYVFDNLKKQKTVALYLPSESIKVNRNRVLTKYELGF